MLCTKYNWTEKMYYDNSKEFLELLQEKHNIDKELSKNSK